MPGLDGRVAVVTGGTRGVGLVTRRAPAAGVTAALDVVVANAFVTGQIAGVDGGPAL